MKNMNPQFGEKIRALRKARKLTLEEAGEKIGISPAQLSSYETGHRNISAMRLNEFANLYDVSTDYLLGRNENIQKNPVHDPADEAALIDFLQSIRKYGMDRFKVIVKVMEFIRKQFETLDRPDIPITTLAQTYKEITDKSKNSK